METRWKNNMDGSIEEIFAFLRQFPNDFNTARQSVDSDNLNVLAYWHLRMQNSMNMFNVLEGK